MSDSERSGAANRILLAIEPGAHAAALVKVAIQLARRVEAEVLVITVRERAFTRGLIWDVYPPGELAETVSQAIYELQRLGIRARGMVGMARVGHVADEIVSAALEYRVAEIVIGHPRRSFLSKLLASSVSDRVLQKAPIPVMTVPTGRSASFAGLAARLRLYQPAT
jgi:nucleotide-binding universal stress UspA family protein